MKTIHFVDYGQDCLSWDIDEQGHVICCRPYDDPYFKGVKVVNHATIERGDFATIEITERVTKQVSTKFITYPIDEVFHHDMQFAASN